MELGRDQPGQGAGRMVPRPPRRSPAGTDSCSGGRTKTGGMTDRMALVAAHNVAADISGGSKIDGLALAATCIAGAGNTAFWMTADPFLLHGGGRDIARGKWARTSRSPSRGTIWRASATIGSRMRVRLVSSGGCRASSELQGRGGGGSTRRTCQRRTRQPTFRVW